MKRKAGIPGILAIFAVLTILLPGSAVMAAQDGSGETSQFTLVSSSIPDGQSDVSPDQTIALKFSKNVANILVKDNNLACFKLTDESGQLVPIEVIIADDQMERDKRNDIVVKPVGKLAEAKQFTLTISDKLKAKNGESLGTAQKITFATVGYQESQSPAATNSAAAGGQHSAWLLGAAVVVLGAGAFWLFRTRAS